MKLYIKDSIVKPKNKIVIVKDGMNTYNPTEEMILADGWIEYAEPKPTTARKSRQQIVQEFVIKQYNQRTDISNDEALDNIEAIDNWDDYIGMFVDIGKILVYCDSPYRVRQAHTISEIYPPSIDTASLYEFIDREHSGDIEDPIPYNPPMEIFENKYYLEDDVMYRCTRDSGTALVHNLKDLVNLYVVIV